MDNRQTGFVANGKVKIDTKRENPNIWPSRVHGEKCDRSLFKK